MSYYKDQLSKIKGNAMGFPAQIKLSKNGINTNWMSLNDGSASALVEWLKANYNVTEDTKYTFGGEWSLTDIKDQANERLDVQLTDKQAIEISENISRTHDATIGINWDVINCHIDDYIVDMIKPMLED